MKNGVLALNESQSQTSVTFSTKDIFMATCIYANNPKQLSNNLTELSLGIGKKKKSLGDQKYSHTLQTRI